MEEYKNIETEYGMCSKEDASFFMSKRKENTMRRIDIDHNFMEKS